MRFEDIKKLATGNVLFDLRRVIAPRLVTIAYLVGLAAILLWAINHFFYAFRFGFGNGLWGLIEITVFGLLALIALRVTCEAIIIYFKAHKEEAAEVAVTPVRSRSTLIDDVRDAIEDLADQEPEDDVVSEEIVVPAPTAAPSPSVEPVRPVTPASETTTPAEEISKPKTE